MAVPTLTRFHLRRRAREIRAKHSADSVEHREKLSSRLMQDWKTRYANLDSYAIRAGLSNTSELKYLRQYLNSFGSETKGNQRARLLAMHEMARSPQARLVLPYLCMAALRDPIPDVRVRAIRKIALLKDPSAEAMMRMIALKDTNEDVRRNAIETLGEFKTPKTRQTLMNIVSRMSEHNSFHIGPALRSLSRVGDVQSIHDLFRLFVRMRSPLFDAKWSGHDGVLDGITDAIRSIGHGENGNVFEAKGRYPHLKVSPPKSLAVDVYIFLHPEKYKTPTKYQGDEGPWNVSDDIQALREEAAKMTFEQFVKKKGLLRKLQGK